MKRNEHFFHVNGVPYFERVRKSEVKQNTESVNKDSIQAAINSLNKKNNAYITLLI